MGRKVTVFMMQAEEGRYLAFAPLFPSCTTSGATVDEALDRFRDSLSLALADATEDDLEALDLSHASRVVVGEVDVEVPVSTGGAART